MESAAAPPAEPVTSDPLGLNEDDGDAAGDKRTLDLATAAGTARAVYGMEARTARVDQLGLDL